MNKSDLVELVVKETRLTKVNVELVLNSALELISQSLKKKEDVSLVRFGTFKIIEVPSRSGRDPRTGKQIQIKASNRVRFSVSKTLRNTVN